jgi:hypothetical protein
VLEQSEGARAGKDGQVGNGPSEFPISRERQAKDLGQILNHFMHLHALGPTRTGFSFCRLPAVIQFSARHVCVLQEADLKRRELAEELHSRLQEADKKLQVT